MARKKMAQKKNNTPRPARSPKAGCPPQEVVSMPQTRRRQRSAHAAVRRDSMLLQTDDGPRVVWGVTKPKVKKR